MPQWYRRTPGGTWIVCVHAQPGARRTEVAGLHGDALRIRVQAPPLEDRANEALADFLARALGVARREVTLVAGARSRAKRFEIGGAAADPASLLSP